MDPTSNLTTLQGGRYELLKKLGEGGKGIVFRARDTSLDRLVAVKVIKPEGFDEASYERFLREAQIAARLTHPHIVSIYDMGNEQGRYFLIMELVDGPSLRGLLEAHPGSPLETAVALRVAIETCQALRFAHAKGVLHRDIKPENLMITSDGNTKLMDFGLARALDQPRLTAALTIVGTPAYLAPEVALGKESDARSDLYSLGAVLYETVTGRPPFQGDDTLKLVYSHIHDPPTRPSRLQPSISPALEGLILRLLSKNPEDRFASASDALRALEEIQRTVPAAAHEVVVAPPSPSAAAGAAGRSSPGVHRVVSLVGRSAEFGALRAVVDRTLAQDGSVVFLTGEAGIGKTRLAGEVRGYAAGRGVLCLTARCTDREASMPYGPWVSLLRELFERTPLPQLYKTAGPNASQLVRLVPELAEKVGLPPAATSGPQEQDQPRLLEGVSQFLITLAAETPLLLLIDDLPLADRPTLQLLEVLARRIRGRSLSIVATCRDVPASENPPFHRLVLDLNRERLVTSVPLHRLDSAGVRQLIQDSLGETDVSAEFLHLLYDKTGGNPFFVEEVLRSLAEEGAIFRKDGGWDRKPTSEIRLPETIRSVILQRLSHLSEESLMVLRLASVAGMEFSFELLADVSGLEEEKLLESLEQALKARLISEHRVAAGRSVYAFADQQIRDVLYEEISIVRARRSHLKVGLALEQLEGARAGAHTAELAHHFLRGNDGPRALRYSVLAGDASVRMFARDEAIRHYKVAIDLLEAEPDEGLLARLEAELGELSWGLGNVEATGRYLSAASERYERLGKAREAAEVLARLGYMRYSAHYDLRAARKTYEHAVALLGGEPEGRELARVEVELAQLLIDLNEFARAGELVAHALGVAERLGAKDVLVPALYFGARLVPRNDFPRAWAMFQRVETVARESGDWRALTYIGRLTGLSESDDLTRDRQTFAWLTQEAHKRSKLGDEMDLRGQSYAYLRMMLGELGEGRSEAEATLEFARANYPMADTPNLAILGFLRALQGDTERGLAALAESMAREQGQQLSGLAAEFVVLEGEVRMLTNDLAGAERLFRRAVEMARPTAGFALMVRYYLHAVNDLIEVRFLQGSSQGVAELAAEATAIAADIDRPYHTGYALRAEALAAALRGDTPTAVARLSGSVRSFESMHYNYEVARGLFYWAEVLRRSGDRAAAAEPMRRALDLFRRFDSKLDVARVVASLEMLKA